MRCIALTLGILSLAAPAAACWDGYRATSEHVEILGDDTAWSLARAEGLATWLPRFEALLAPSGAMLSSEFGVNQLEMSDGSIVALPRSKQLRRIFEATARAVQASAAQTQAAMLARSNLLTVQIAATHNINSATTLAARVSRDELGDHGFYEAGGFPAFNPTAHVVAGPNGSQRVFVGLFLDRAQAEQVASELRDQTHLAAFVRTAA